MWIGETPGKLRLEVIGIHGQPVLSMASDGERFYAYSFSENKYYKRRIKDNSLQQFISIPIRLTTISQLLMGRIPVFPNENAAIVENETESGYLLYIQEKATGRIQKLFLDDTQSDVFKIEYLTSNGSLLYRVMFGERNIIETVTIPTGFSVSTEEGDSLEIEVDRCWVDVSVNPSIFMIQPPD